MKLIYPKYYKGQGIIYLKYIYVDISFWNHIFWGKLCNIWTKSYCDVDVTAETGFAGGLAGAVAPCVTHRWFGRVPPSLYLIPFISPAQSAGTSSLSVISDSCRKKCSASPYPIGWEGIPGSILSSLISKSSNLFVYSSNTEQNRSLRNRWKRGQLQSSL